MTDVGPRSSILLPPGLLPTRHVGPCRCQIALILESSESGEILERNERLGGEGGAALTLASFVLYATGCPPP